MARVLRSLLFPPASRLDCRTAVSAAYNRTLARSTSGGREHSDVHLYIHPEVTDAVASGQPVVAMETTILTHGMPHPTNFDTAMEVEGIVRSEGAVPATIGVLDGRVHVGLTRSQLARLADPSMSDSVRKTSRRDLAYVLSQARPQWRHDGVGHDAVCSQGWYPRVCDGGIGGVHRGGEHTMDVSADLTELGRTPVAVLCAGVKSILDIGRTLEVLETQGVPVATYGPTNEFPAFFTPHSSFQAPFRVETPLECARLIDSTLSFGIGSGLLIAVPIPYQSTGLGLEIESKIQQALEDARKNGILGKAVTPYVLQRVNDLTAGESLKANVALMRNNARVGAQTAVALAKLRWERTGSGDQSPTVADGCQTGAEGRRRRRKRSENSDSHAKRPVVIGASVADFVAKIKSSEILREGTNPGSLQQSFGGVGRNITECLTRLGLPPLFISAVGQDTNGKALKEHLLKCGVTLDGVFQSSSSPTAMYCVVLDSQGETHCAIGDMDINHCISAEWVSGFQRELQSASIVCVDGNVEEECLQYVCSSCAEARVPVWYEPTCVSKAVKPVLAGCVGQLSCATPNLVELMSMHVALSGGELSSVENTAVLSREEKMDKCVSLAPALLQHVPLLLVSLGSDGVMAARRKGEGAEYDYYPPASNHLLPVKVINVTGAGDSFVGAVIAGVARGDPTDLAVKAGLKAAYLSVQSVNSVSHGVTPELFTESSIQEWAPWTPTRFY